MARARESLNTVENITNFYIDTLDKCLSDMHRPICVEYIVKIDLYGVEEADDKEEIINTQDHEETKYYWRNGAQREFRDSFLNEDVINIDTDIKNASRNASPELINVLGEKITRIYLNAANTANFLATLVYVQCPTLMLVTCLYLI